MSNYKDVKNFRTRLKERATYVLGDKCQCCGYDKCLSALDFHHLNPSEKDFNFNSNANRSWEATRKEIAKCILVCANCHREIHAGLIDNNTLKSSFSEERAKEIDALVDKVKHREIHYCKGCGVEVSRDSAFCIECSNLNKRVCDRPTREELKNLIRITPFTQIARQFNVSDNAIRKWCDAYGLPRKASEIKRITDEEWKKI